MTIRVVYTEEPSFPATDQHPDAVRYQIGQYWVDAIGDAPTQADVDALLTPVDATPSTEDRLKALESVLVQTSIVKQVDLDNAVTSIAQSDMVASPVNDLAVKP